MGERLRSFTRRRTNRDAEGSRESAQTIAELAIIVGVLAVVVIIGVVAFRTNLVGWFDQSSQEVGTFKPPVTCDSNYSGGCIPPYPPDINCSDLPGVSGVTVTGSDPHELDGDGDGIICN